MRVKAVILTSLLFYLIILKGQTTINEISLGWGSVAYNNSFSLPSGLPGGSFALMFNRDKINGNKKFTFNTRLQYYRLIKDGILTNTATGIPYQMGEVKLTCQWGRELPVVIPGLNAWFAFGSSFNGLFGGRSSYPNFTGQSMYFNEKTGHWYFSTELNLLCIKDFKTMRLHGQIHMPIFVLGHFQEYQGNFLGVNFGENFKYYAIPNSIAAINTFFYPDINVSVVKFISKNKRIGIKLSYNFQHMNSGIHNNRIAKNNNIVLIGLIIKGK